MDSIQIIYLLQVDTILEVIGLTQYSQIFVNTGITQNLPFSHDAVGIAYAWL
jgi:hypothetical protein